MFRVGSRLLAGLEQQASSASLLSKFTGDAIKSLIGGVDFHTSTSKLKRSEDQQDTVGINPWEKNPFLFNLSTRHQCSTSTPSDTEPEGENRLVIYKGRWMVPLYVLVRLKVFQLVAFGSLAIPLNTFFVQGSVEPMIWGITLAIVFGAGTASTALWFYSRRYIGELALLGKHRDRVQISVMDFWGNREENDVPLEAIVPPLRGLSPTALSVIAQHAFIPLDVQGSRQFFMTLRYGRICDKEMLFRLLDGRLEEEMSKH
ncbi:hypothetical protein BSKO_07474 [Bryopsis sp. KO-2023]|nr:hypothetical protein BSKO_07474 [Bryopsis sp. KO-2023]